MSIYHKGISIGSADGITIVDLIISSILELKTELQALAGYYCRLMPSCLEGYKHASLQFLAEFLQDPLEEIASLARTCFSSSVVNLSMNEKRDKIAYWSNRLPSRISAFSESSMAATIILGNMCIDDSSPFNEE